MIAKYDVWKEGTTIKQKWGFLSPGGGRMVHLTIDTSDGEGLTLYNKLRSGPYALCPVRSTALMLEYDLAFHRRIMGVLNGPSAPVPRLLRLCKKGSTLPKDEESEEDV